MNKKCQDMQALLDLFIMDDLSGKELKMLQDHLDQCADCQRVIEGEAWEKLLLHLPKRRCPERVIRRVESMIRQERKRAGVFRWQAGHWRQTVFAGAALAALLIFLIIRHQPEEHQFTPQAYTQEEIEQAREAMKWTMVYTAQKIKKSETRVIDEVFTHRLPESVQKSVRKVLPILQGD
ncbi:zf-HC2 domain-containing protein [bacterium]|nr:zf-HC2 domain-containing protein [bacterium]